MNLISKHCLTPYPELKNKIEGALKDKKSKITTLELFVMRIFESGIARADYKKLDWIFDKVFPSYNKMSENEKTIVLSYAVENQKQPDKTKEVDNVEFKKIES